jgi:hypothetical protein
VFNNLAEQRNPIARRVLRRTRPMLEDQGLLKRIGVIVHPRAGDGVPAAFFDNEGLVMGYPSARLTKPRRGSANFTPRVVPVPGF